MENDFEGYLDDPEYKEDTPESDAEMYATFKYMGTAPAELKDPVKRAGYATWLKKHEKDT